MRKAQTISMLRNESQSTAAASTCTKRRTKASRFHGILRSQTQVRPFLPNHRGLLPALEDSGKRAAMLCSHPTNVQSENEAAHSHDMPRKNIHYVTRKRAVPHGMVQKKYEVRKRARPKDQRRNGKWKIQNCIN